MNSGAMPMNKGLRKEIYNQLDLKDTDELVEIWETNDREVWSETAFDVIREILEGRLGKVPPQRESGDEEIEPETEDEDEPVFYKTDEVLKMVDWLKQASRYAVIVIVFAKLTGFPGTLYIVQALTPDNLTWSLISWPLALILFGAETAIYCFIVYFSLQALASILKILMEIEFNSRAME
jgi:hypothetical protein